MWLGNHFTVWREEAKSYWGGKKSHSNLRLYMLKFLSNSNFRGTTCCHCPDGFYGELRAGGAERLGCHWASVCQAWHHSHVLACGWRRGGKQRQQKWQGKVTGSCSSRTSLESTLTAKKIARSNLEGGGTYLLLELHQVAHGGKQERWDGKWLVRLKNVWMQHSGDETGKQRRRWNGDRQPKHAQVQEM